MDERKGLAERFEAQRPRLRAVAYRMLGSLSEAEESPLTAYTTTVSGADLQIWGNAMKKFGGFTKTINYSALVYTGK